MNATEIRSTATWLSREIRTHATTGLNSREKWAAMVESRHVRAALRRLRTDKGLSPEALADAAQVDRATVYRIEDLEDTYSPRIETISALVEAMELPISSFFWRVEREVTGVVTGKDQGSDTRQGGSGDPASDERRELFQLREQIEEYKAALGDLENVTSRLTRIAARRAESEAAARTQAARGRRHRKAG